MNLLALAVGIACLAFSSTEAPSKPSKKEVSIFEDSIKIARMLGEDQAARFGYSVLMKKGYSDDVLKDDPNVGKRAHQIDAQNLKAMKKLVAKWGWFPISEFGAYTSHNAWLLVQHADRDVAFQEKCLKNIEVEFKRKEVDGQDYGYLLDRVAVNRGRLQRYGTQGECKGKGKWVPKPMEEPEKVEARRKELGMVSFKEYVAQVSGFCL